MYIGWSSPFCSTDYAGFSQLHKWLTTYVSDNVAEQSGVSQRGIERLLSIYIEILKEIPEVSGLRYPEVEA